MPFTLILIMHETIFEITPDKGINIPYKPNRKKGFFIRRCIFAQLQSIRGSLNFAQSNKLNLNKNP